MSLLGRRRDRGRDDESRLVRRAARGDAEAFGRLYDLYADRVHGYCRARVRDPHDAEDLTEAVFLRAWAAVGAYDERGAPFGAWLFRIARNQVVDAVRSRARVREEPTARLPDAPLPGPGTEDVVLRGIEAERVRRCLCLLTEEQAAAVTLRYLWGFDVAEAARVLGKTEGAVKALQSRALCALRRMLHEEKVAREERSDAV